MKSNTAIFRTILCVAIIVVGSFSAFGQKEMSIAAVQGDRGSSPVDGQVVRVTGIVTAILKRGFYIQTPDVFGSLSI